jgi:hypothetical protein
MSVSNKVQFDTLAREWRCKWSADNDKAALDAVQAEVDAILPQIKAIEGFKKVDRVVCGGCSDYKLIISFHAAGFANLEAANLEAAFLAKIGAIEGISQVETQTYTFMEL